MAVSISPNGKNYYHAADAPDEILVATADGIQALTRTDSGMGWRESRRMIEGKHVGAIVLEPNGTIFAGTHGDGVWVSEDGGQSWERRDNGIESDNVFAMNCVQAGGEVRVYAGTEPAELYVTTDLGKHWTKLSTLRDVPSVKDWTFPGAPHIGHVKTIVFDPRDANTIYVGVEVGGAFKSTDAGATWRELNDSGFYVDVHRLMIADARPDDVWMATGRGLYHSPDAGESWTLHTLPGVDPEGFHRRNDGISYPDALVVRPQQPEVMFTAGASASPGAWRNVNGAFAHIARSRDGGESWQYLTNGLPQNSPANIEAMSMCEYPSGFSLVAATTHGDVFFSDDEGEHWNTIAEELAPISKGGHYKAVRPEWQPAHA